MCTEIRDAHAKNPESHTCFSTLARQRRCIAATLGGGGRCDFETQPNESNPLRFPQVKDTAGVKGTRRLLLPGKAQQMHKIQTESLSIWECRRCVGFSSFRSCYVSCLRSPATGLRLRRSRWQKPLSGFGRSMAGRSRPVGILTHLSRSACTRSSLPRSSFRSRYSHSSPSHVTIRRDWTPVDANEASIIESLLHRGRFH